MARIKRNISLQKAWAGGCPRVCALCAFFSSEKCNQVVAHGVSRGDLSLPYRQTGSVIFSAPVPDLLRDVADKEK